MSKLYKKNLQPLTPEERLYCGPAQYRCVRRDWPATDEEIIGAQGTYLTVPSLVHAEAIMAKRWASGEPCFCYFWDALGEDDWTHLLGAYVDPEEFDDLLDEDEALGRIHIGVPPWLYVRIGDEVKALIRVDPDAGKWIWKPLDGDRLLIEREAIAPDPDALRQEYANAEEGVLYPLRKGLYPALCWLLNEVEKSHGSFETLEVWPGMRLDPVLSEPFETLNPS